MAASGTLFGYGVRSPFSHERLSPAPARRGSIEIGRCDPVRPDPALVTHHHTRSGASFMIARERDGSLGVACSAGGGFRIDAAAFRVLSDATLPGGELWEHRLVTVVAPLLLVETGDVALHAAAIARDDTAVAFVGASTRGKSTLALAADAAGLGVLADDGVVVERVDGGGLVWPGPAGIRVARPGEARKATIAAGAAPLRPATLAAVAVLGSWADDGPLVEPLAPVDAVPALVPSLIFSGPDRLPEAMRSAAWLAASIPVFRCRMPHGVDRLPDAVCTVLDRVLSPAAA